MKRSMFHSLTSCVAVFATAVFSGSAIGQGPQTLPFDFQVTYSEILDDLSVNDIVQVNDGFNDGLYVVGTYSLADDITRGFIYRYEDSKLFDMPTVLGLSNTVVPRTGCYGMNESGIVVGTIRDSDNLWHAVYFNLFELGPDPPQHHSLHDQFAEIPPPSEVRILPYKINSAGDILLQNLGVVVNPFLNVAYQIPGDFGRGIDINDWGTVLALPGSSVGVIRSNIHDPNSAEYFQEAHMAGYPEINNFDEFCAVEDFPGQKRRDPDRRYAVRKGSELRYGAPVDWYSDPFEVLSTNGINDSGDICGEGLGSTELYLHYSSGTEIETGPTVDVQSLVTDNIFDSGYLWKFKITNRIELSPTLSAPIVCGIFSLDGTSNRRMFFLIPEIPPPSDTYSNADTPLDIPDNDPIGIDPPSTIDASDHLITNLTVNVDITHQRPSDLEVYLVPDGGTPVQLFNFSGDNNVANFNGISSLGLWTLEVYDTRNKKTGTLNSWSITVEY